MFLFSSAPSAAATAAIPFFSLLLLRRSRTKPRVGFNEPPPRSSNPAAPQQCQLLFHLPFSGAVSRSSRVLWKARMGYAHNTR